jgi:hypothetical protein
MDNSLKSSNKKPKTLLRNFGKNNMKAEEKIYKVLERIKSKTDLAPVGSVIDYRAGWEINELGAEEEILILNKLAEDGIIEVTQNFANEYM